MEILAIYFSIFGVANNKNVLVDIVLLIFVFFKFYSSSQFLVDIFLYTFPTILNFLPVEM